MLKQVADRLGATDLAIATRDRAVRAYRRVTDAFVAAVLVGREGRRLPGLDAVVVVDRSNRRRAVWARVRSDDRGSAAVRANQELAEGILQRSRIPYRRVGLGVLEAPLGRRDDIASSVGDLGRAVHISRTAANGSPSTPPPRAPQFESDAVTVFEFTRTSRGTAVYGAEYGCRINLVRDVLPAGAHPSDPVRPGFEVDVVYTWVDGSDPRWIERRRRVERLVDPHRRHPEAASRARYASFDELRYSLRSLERYAEFVRHVFVVTDGQCPEWLVDGHDRLTIVDHREIFEDVDHSLPTFNSHSIESRLHHVPGLAEHYLYLNDDMIFGRRVTVDDFFDEDGRAHVFASHALAPMGPVTSATKPVDAAAINVIDLVNRAFDVDVQRNKFKHAPYPQRRAVHEELERLFPDEMHATMTSRFRSPDDIAVASSLHQHAALQMGLGVHSTIDSEYVDLGQGHLRTRLDRLRRNPMPQVYCLNDSDLSATPDSEKASLVSWFFEDELPGASSFER